MPKKLRERISALSQKATQPETVSEVQKPIIPKLAFSMAETAEAIGVSYITVHRLLQRGLLKSSSALRTKVISRAEIDRFLST